MDTVISMMRWIKNDFYSDNSIITRKEQMVISVVFFMIFASYLYTDTIAIIRYGINVSQSFYYGHGLEFYSFCISQMQNGHGDFYCEYNYINLIILGIWQLPLSIIEIVKNGYITTDHFMTALYGKSILVIFAILCSLTVRKISRYIVKSKLSAIVHWLFLSSVLVIVNVGIVGQSDIIGMFFELLAVYYYIKQDIRKCFIFFSLAICFKLYSLFIFVPLLFLYEKKLLRILSIMCMVLLPYVFFECLWKYFDPNGFAVKAERASQNFMSIFLSMKLPLMDGQVSLMIVTLGLICTWCYLHKFDCEKPYRVIYLCFFIYMVIFISFPAYNYWRIRLALYTVLLISINISYARINFLLEGLFSGFLMISNYLSTPIYYELINGHNGNIMLLSKLGYWFSFYKLKDLFGGYDFGSITSILNAFFVVCLLSFAYYNRDLNNNDLEINDIDLRYIIRCRIMAFLLLALLPVALALRITIY